MVLIDLNAVKEWIENWLVLNKYYHPHSKNNSIPISELYDVFERMPKFELVYRGHWEEYGVTKKKCSVCGTGYSNTQMPYSFNYCPHCGAKMDGGKDNADE